MRIYLISNCANEGAWIVREDQEEEYRADLKKGNSNPNDIEFTKQMMEKYIWIPKIEWLPVEIDKALYINIRDAARIFAKSDFFNTVYEFVKQMKEQDHALEEKQLIELAKKNLA